MTDRYGNPDHDCRDHLTELPDDPMLPDYITRLECERCGEWFERDDRDGEITVDR
jgi:hypothetical protein